MTFEGNKGYCCICMGNRRFIAKTEWLRDTYVCEKCGTVPRMRALVEVLNIFRPDWRKCAIHESSPSMPFFSQQCKSYSHSFFYDDVPLGSINPADNNRCENLEALTFRDETFDIFITQDVLEHVFNPDKALTQIMRVLRKGGMHVFTAPKHKHILTSVQRALMNNGQVEYLMEPVYHDGPIGHKRSLVTWDFGADFDDLIKSWSGYNTCNFIIRDRRRGIDGEFLDVFVTTKEPLNAFQKS